MIYCVVPRQLSDDLLDRLSEYYRDEPNVTVIVDRRGDGGQPISHPHERDRRRQRVKGSFPPIEPTADSGC